MDTVFLLSLFDKSDNDHDEEDMMLMNRRRQLFLSVFEFLNFTVCIKINRFKKKYCLLNTRTCFVFSDYYFFYF